MANLFNWQSIEECDDSADAEACVAKEGILEAKALIVSDPDSCEKDLCSLEYPAVPIARSDSDVQLWDGSALRPLRLDRLQRQTGGSFPALMILRPDGTMLGWNPDDECNDHRLVVRDQLIQAVPDDNPAIFDQQCACNASDVTHIAGATLFTDCNGDEKFSICFFPRDQACNYCS